MLSNRAEQFLIELRMYLIQRGKNDQDINNIVEELETHLIEAEKNGKNIEQIIGQSPKHYMKSIGESMPFDKKQTLTLVPMTLLVLIAIVCYMPAIDGKFSLSKNTLFFGSIAVVLTLGIYALFLFKAAPKLINSTVKLSTLYISLSLLSIGGWVGFFLWLQDQPDTVLFTATLAQNYIIAAVCALMIITFSIYTKSWLLIFMAICMSIAPICNRLIPPKYNNDPVFITITGIVIVLITIAIFVFMYKKSKKDNKAS